MSHEHTHDHEHDHAYLHAHGIAHSHGHVHENQKAVINRLARAIGHLEKVKRMVEEGHDCSEVLVQLVDDIRHTAGRPAHASSGLRCSVWNSLQGGVSGSRHLSGKALDFSVEGMSGRQLLTLVQSDPRTRYAYVIDGGWVHVDVQ